MDNMKRILVGALFLSEIFSFGCSKKSPEEKKVNEVVSKNSGSKKIQIANIGILDEGIKLVNDGLIPAKFEIYDPKWDTSDFVWGYIDIKLNTVITPIFSEVHNFREGKAAIRMGNLEWGYINQKGRKIIDFAFEDAKDFGEGLAAVKKMERWGFVDTSGKIVIEPRFDDAGYFANGLAPVNIGRLWGYIDKTGKYIIEPKYNSAGEFRDGFALVELKNKYFYINPSGENAFNKEFTNAKPFSDGLAAVQVSIWEWGYIDKTGNLALKEKYDYTGSFSDEFAIVVKENKDRYGYSIIDRNGNVITGERVYDAIGLFSNGMASVKNNERWGCIDLSGKLVIPIEFDSIGVFLNEKAIAKMGSRKGFIDRTGKWIE